MKYVISYLPEEEREMAADLAALRRRHPNARIRKLDQHPPFRHIYITTGKRKGRKGGVKIVKSIAKKR